MQRNAEFGNAANKKILKNNQKTLAKIFTLLYTTEAVCFRDEAVSCGHGHGR